MPRRLLEACVLLLGVLTIAPAPTAQAPAQPAAANNCQPGQDLVTIPEIRSENGKLRGEIEMTSGKRTLWGSAGDTRCVQQDIRYFTGRSLQGSNSADPVFASGTPVPGPTLRARVGDLVEIKYLNHVDPNAFSGSLDQASHNPANTTGCDEVRSQGRSGLIYPNPTSGTTPGDVMPNCMHGSSTSNLHFHGTHTTPDTTGDNVLLFVTPALRSGSMLQPSNAFVDAEFAKIFAACEANGTPTRWDQLPATWRADQEKLLKQYDRTAPFRGEAGKLPHDMQLWPPNQQLIANGKWPQYQLGASPYCFRLTDATTMVDGKPRYMMGQAPGTHWYHAHKHGSTALNVANGLTGAFVIEGQYDDDLRKFYGRDLREQVLMIQQLSTTPFPLISGPPVRGPGTVPKPQLSVNGRLNPIIHMRPGEVQLWRIVNGAFRDAVQIQSFSGQGLAWRQIAQDGVQLTFANYASFGAMNRQFNLAPANRADILVRATQAGTYTLTVQQNEGLPLDPNNVPKTVDPVTLLTVQVGDTPISPAKDFIQNESDFPTFPTFLKDIQESEISVRRQLDFGAGHNLIDGKTFDADRYSQIMELNSAEEWKISNEAPDKAHPFHIHVNPFQVTEVFSPNAPNINTTHPDQPCYVDPMNPQTWKPCQPLAGPFVWWDTFAIPASFEVNLPAATCTTKAACPPQIQPHVSCTTGASAQCTVTIPGYFKMRTRFVDFTGSYVLHCHILIHEDRGMMQLIEVVTDKPVYTHK